MDAPKFEVHSFALNDKTVEIYLCQLYSSILNANFNEAQQCMQFSSANAVKPSWQVKPYGCASKFILKILKQITADKT